MIFDIVFSETRTEFVCDFQEVNNISDGGFEQGLAQLRARCDLSIVEYQDKNLTTLGDYAFFRVAS